jgi:hypothetical protein
VSHLCLLWIIALADVSGEPPPRHRAEERAVEICQLIVESASRQDVPPELAVAVAWNESRLRWHLTSPRGAAGPMQVIARHWCPDRRGRWTANGEHIVKGCDLIAAGVLALSYYLETRSSLGAALKSYGGTQAYAHRVIELWEAID